MQIRRNRYLNQIRKYYDSNLIKVITRIRRCGKSVLLNQIKEENVDTYLIDDEHLTSLNFGDAKFSKITKY